MSSIPRTLGRARPASPLSRVSRATATIALALLAAVAGACTTPPPLRPEQRAAVRIEEAEAALIFEGPDVAQAGFDEAFGGLERGGLTPGEEEETKILAREKRMRPVPVRSAG